MPPIRLVLPRRALGAIALAACVAPAGADRLATALRDVMPPGLDPLAVGRRLLAAPGAPSCRGDCLARAGVDTALPAAPLRARVAEDFADGRVVAVDGWRLSATEAWMCAALASTA
jgi:hypothetical protein